MILKSFISVTVWNLSGGVEAWWRSRSKSASRVQSFFIIDFSSSFHFHSSVILVFSSLFCLCLAGLCPFSGLYYSCSIEHWPFFSFVLSLIIVLCFHFLLFLSRVTVARGIGLGDWSEVRLVTTAAGNWLAVRWIAVAGDWFEVGWVEAIINWFKVRCLAGEDD